MRVKDWIKTHKIATAGIIVGVVIIVWAAFMMFVSLSGARSTGVTSSYPEFIALESPLGFDFSLREVSESGLKMPSESGEEIEVKEGSMKIESESAEEDFAEIESLVGNYQGYLERSRKSITNLYIQLDVTLRVPSENFANLVEELKEEFEVESYNVKNYRIPVGRELDELQILNESLSDYEKIRDEIKEMNVGKDKIELLMQLTDKELGLKEKERTYQNIVSSKERRGEYATLNVNLKQKKSPTIWPENVLDQFKDRLRKALDNTVKTLKDLVGGSIEIFFKAIQIAVYIFIVGIVLAGLYRLGRELFRFIIRKKGPAEKI
jgi:hypothetical protein